MDVLSNWLELSCNYFFSLMSVDGLLENKEAEVKLVQARKAYLQKNSFRYKAST